MASPRYIRHITLTTGHVRDSWRQEISDEALAACADLLAQVAADPSQMVSIPGFSDYYLSGQPGGACWVGTVWTGSPSVCVVTIGIAAHSRCGASLWRELHRWGQTPVVTDPERCPAEPWVAVALDEGALTHLDAMEWLGDFERCLAWAWVESRQRPPA